MKEIYRKQGMSSNLYHKKVINKFIVALFTIAAEQMLKLKS